MLHPGRVHISQDVIHEINGGMSFACRLVRRELDVAVIGLLPLAGASGYDTGDIVHQLDEIDDAFVDLDGFARP